MEHPDASIDLTRLEFVRTYDPSITSWRLSQTGLSRVENNLLPPGLPIRAYSLLRLMKRLDLADDDELAAYQGVSARSTKMLLKRLMGYGYVEQVT